MSNNKQSSVEWLINEIERRVSIIQSEPPTMVRETMIDNLAIDLQQAKAMHKEEIMDAYDDGWHHSNENFYNPIRYYNETYGSNNE